MQVPRIEPKLRVFSFKIQFQAQVGKHLICVCSSLHFIICPYPVKLFHSTMSFTGFWATEKSEYCKFSSGSGKYFPLLFVYLRFSWGEGGAKGGKVVTSMSCVQDLEAAIRGEKRASVGIKISHLKNILTRSEIQRNWRELCKQSFHLEMHWTRERQGVC